MTETEASFFHVMKFDFGGSVNVVGNRMFSAQALQTVINKSTLGSEYAGVPEHHQTKIIKEATFGKIIDVEQPLHNVGIYN